MIFKVKSINTVDNAGKQVDGMKRPREPPTGCEFCHVGCKEGRRSRKVADLSEFWKGQKNIVLCDPNTLACPEHMELLQQLKDSKARANFNQGLDVRLMNEKNIELLKQIKLEAIHIAYDRYTDKDIVEKKNEDVQGNDRVQQKQREGDSLHLVQFRHNHRTRH